MNLVASVIYCGGTFTQVRCGQSEYLSATDQNCRGAFQCFPMCSVFFFMKQLAKERSINCMPFKKKINKEYICLFNFKKSLEQLSHRKEGLRFPLCSFSGISASLRSVLIHSHLITGNNVLHEITTLCSILCQKFFTHDKKDRFLNFHQDARKPPCRHLLVTQTTWY